MDNNATGDEGDGDAQDDVDDGNVIEPPKTIQKEVRKGRTRRNSNQGKINTLFIIFPSGPNSMKYVKGNTF